jgi:hypothetical protein
MHGGFFDGCSSLVLVVVVFTLSLWFGSSIAAHKDPNEARVKIILTSLHH